MSKRLIASALLCLLAFACASQESSSVERTIDIGTHALQARVLGEGPAVVVDVGIAGRSEEWQPFQNQLADEALVLLYDRAGYPESDPGPLPRDSTTVVDELKALLDAASIPGPYVLVGHSLGALNMQLFAARYPEEVAGLVLLDPPPLGWILGEGFPELLAMAEQMTQEWQTIANRGASSSDPQQRAEAIFFETIASEHREMFGGSAQRVAAIDTFDDTPLVVIASGRPNPAFGEAAQEFQSYWASESRAVAAKSTRGEFVFVEESSHRLHEEAAEIVLESVRSVLEQAGER